MVGPGAMAASRRHRGQGASCSSAASIYNKANDLSLHVYIKLLQTDFRKECCRSCSTYHKFTILNIINTISA